MYPVSGLDQVRICWLEIQREGYRIFAFLLYTGADNIVVEYMKEGIYDLDALSGKHCAIFAIEPPTKRWIEYTRQSKHGWWTLYGKKVSAAVDLGPTKWLLRAIERFLSLVLFRNIVVKGNSNCTVVIGNNNQVSLGHLVAPELDLLYNRSEAFKVAKHFKLQSVEVPCLVLFKDLDSRIIYKSSLGGFSTQREINRFFRGFFESKEYKDLLF